MNPNKSSIRKTLNLLTGTDISTDSNKSTNRQIETETDKIRQKLKAADRHWQKQTEADWSLQKETKTDRNGQNGTEIDINELKWTETDKDGQRPRDKKKKRTKIDFLKIKCLL